MKVLWFTNTPSCYSPLNKGNQVNGYNGGGWISSAEKALSQCSNIKLAISFLMDEQPFHVSQNGVDYYPIPVRKKGFIKKIKDTIGLMKNQEKKVEEISWNYYLSQFKNVVDDFNPDIIHVWGSEGYFGLVSKITDKPVLLHIQGLINPYLNALLPPAVSWNSIYSRFSFKKFLVRKHWLMSAYREKEIYKGIDMFLGRTEWDRRVSYILNNKAQYSMVNEILRMNFYCKKSRQIPSKLIIVSTISQPMYKGFDLVLKTAWHLKNDLDVDFEWKCFGNINPIFIEKFIGIKHTDVNVKLEGVVSAESIIKEELGATLYFHPSYIDNSPNSLCEAQILGLPVIASNVGGVSSLVEDSKDGYLIPANDPYQAAYLIYQLFRDERMNIHMGALSKDKALKRHKKENVINEILTAYQTILHN